MSARRTSLFALVLFATEAFSGSRAVYGGSLKVTAITEKTEPTAELSDTPVEASLLLLRQSPLCDAVEVTLTVSGAVHLSPRGGITAKSIESTINALSKSASPYARLLELTKPPVLTADGIDLDSPLRGGDLEAALCHPALSIATGPFTTKGDTLTARADVPDGRPYVDEIALSKADARGAERQLSARRTHVVIGGTSPEPTPAFFGTFLVRNSTVPESLLAAVNSSIDKGDLTRFFVKPPAEPMWTLAWPAIDSTKPPAPPKPAALSPARELRLAFDVSNEDHRAVAERLQVKLQSFGYRVVLQPLARSELRTHWNASDFDVFLQNVLLTPSSHVSATIVNELASRTRVKGDATAAVIPLYVRGVAVTAAPEVRNLHRNLYGLPDLADAFLSAE